MSTSRRTLTSLFGDFGGGGVPKCQGCSCQNKIKNTRKFTTIYNQYFFYVVINFKSMSNLRQNLLGRGGKRFSHGLCKDCTPVKWTKYFNKQQKVTIDNDIFNVYMISGTGPLLVLIHGGGYSSLTWSLFAEEIISKLECQVLAVDLRGHGDTKTSDDDNLSLNVLAEDVSNIIDALYQDSEVPALVLIGHSLGGAVAVALASFMSSVVGLCVIDVVEGTALESLASMQSILRGRPSSFNNIESAIQWSFRGGQTHNLEAARISMPGQITNILTGELAANECEEFIGDQNLVTSPEVKPIGRLVHQRSADAIEEENEGDFESKPCGIENGSDSLPADNRLPPINNHLSNAAFKVPNASSYNKYVWRIDLSKTEPFWNGWFKGLSQKFLDVQVPKVLLLANIHGLDTSLTVGQMQGKFQLQVLPKSGHAIHEDQPHRVADIVAGFLVKQKLAVGKVDILVMPAC